MASAAQWRSDIGVNEKEAAAWRRRDGIGGKAQLSMKAATMAAK